MTNSNTGYGNASKGALSLFLTCFSHYALLTPPEDSRNEVSFVWSWYANLVMISLSVRHIKLCCVAMFFSSILCHSPFESTPRARSLEQQSLCSLSYEHEHRIT